MGFSVKLEVFEGPLELLLYLIKRDRLNIYEIPIAHITNEYLGYIKMMQELDVELASEFLDIASLLLRIKARSLLPRTTGDQDEELPDPREELTQKLLMYQKFREFADILRQHEHQGRLIYPVSINFKAPQTKTKSVMEVIELISAAREVNQRIKARSAMTFFLNLIPLELRIDQIREKISRWKLSKFKFEKLLEGKTDRDWIIVNFIAILELAKNSQISINQPDVFGDIWIQAKNF